MIEANEKGKVIWEAPSNLAIVKYWGKYGRQLPRNPSISLTLSEAKTKTEIEYQKNGQGEFSFEFFFEGQKNEGFEKRLSKFFNSIRKELPFINDYHFVIRSENSFPHSSGIASSASAMAALSLCLLDVRRVTESRPEENFLYEASHFARLGSGSASRSVFKNAAIWGKHKNITDSSDEHAIGFEKVHQVFKNYHDDILIVSSDEKAVSSSAGHQLMENNVYASARFQQAFDHCNRLYSVMQKGDLQEFIKIAEDEALTLHALMMSSNPSYILLEPQSIAIIKTIRAFRKETNIPICFSIDAGPNIHVLYPNEYKLECHQFIEQELKTFCESGYILRDKVGKGPVKHC